MIFVDETAEYLVASDGPVDWYGDWPVVVVGCALVSGLVGPMSVVMPRVFGQGPGCVVLVVDQDAVGALATDGAHEPFGVTVRPRGPRWRFDDRDVLAVKYCIEAGRKLGVAVSEEEAERADPFAEIHSQVAGGLGDPLSPRMGGHPQDVDPAGAYFDHEQYVQASQEHGVEMEEGVRRPAASSIHWAGSSPG